MYKFVSVAQARKQWASILKAVDKYCHTYFITYYGKEIARISPVYEQDLRLIRRLKIEQKEEEFEWLMDVMESKRHPDD